ncbi:hypothetical protein SDC9_149687 [bioreactor metagenome]|uniref:Uncharacterized protein n=1 Tax=bioreactor metagenome TaxID=1076179 RepID=A0A645EKG7_9ZZZZ
MMGADERLHPAGLTHIFIVKAQMFRNGKSHFPVGIFPAAHSKQGRRRKRTPLSADHGNFLVPIAQKIFNRLLRFRRMVHRYPGHFG